MTVGKSPENHEAVIGGHDWYSLWVGLVLAHNQPALATWDEFIRLGFTVEVESVVLGCE